jgi:hypothetical protein
MAEAAALGSLDAVYAYVPRKLALDVAAAVERGKLRSSDPDVISLLPQLLGARPAWRKPVYYSLPCEAREVSICLILALFLSDQHGTAASFLPCRWGSRYFDFKSMRDTLVMVEDILALFGEIGEFEVNGRRWRCAGVGKNGTKNAVVVSFARALE